MHHIIAINLMQRLVALRMSLHAAATAPTHFVHTSARSCGSEHQEAAQLRVLDRLGAAGRMAAAVGSAESTCSKWLSTPRSRVCVIAVWDAALWPSARGRRAPERHAHSICIVPSYL